MTSKKTSAHGCLHHGGVDREPGGFFARAHLLAETGDAAGTIFLFFFIAFRARDVNFRRGEDARGGLRRARRAYDSGPASLVLAQFMTVSTWPGVAGIHVLWFDELL